MKMMAGQRYCNDNAVPGLYLCADVVVELPPRALQHPHHARLRWWCDEWA